MNGEQAKQAVERATVAAEKGLGAAELTRWLSIVTLILCLALSIQLRIVSDTVDEVKDHAQTSEQAAKDSKTAAEEAAGVARDVQEVTPEEQARSDAITNAVALVPKLLTVLCDHVGQTTCEELVGP